MEMTLVYFVLFIVSSVLTNRYCVLLNRTNKLDIPNHRSAHNLPKPRGGGLVFASLFLMAMFYFVTQHAISQGLFFALFIAGGVVSALGMLDDFKEISFFWRLLGHFFAVIVLMGCLGKMGPIGIAGFSLPSNLFVHLAFMVYFVWLINLYNFMDGIDGLAASEAIFVSVASAYLYYLGGFESQIGPQLALAGTVSGFLIWNFPPARIFMGDVGSGFLGVIFAVLTFHSASLSSALFWSWFILLGVFVVDSSVTLVARFIRGAQVFQAHNNHAYQHAARKFKHHGRVVKTVFIINVFWLFPIALLAVKGLIDGFIGLCIAYVPLIFLCVLSKAGQEVEPTEASGQIKTAV